MDTLKKYKNIRKILDALPGGRFYFLCELIKRHEESILEHFKIELENMDFETFKTTTLPERYFDKLPQFAHGGYPFWKPYDKENRLKFLDIIINRIEKLGK